MGHASSLQLIRVFLSSPGDVADERNIAQHVVEDLKNDSEFHEHFDLALYRWDDPKVRLPMDAGETPQKSVNVYMIRPSECDLVVVIYGARMGTPLVMDKRSYLSGTHYEYCEALEAKRTQGKPRVWLYRCTQVPELKLDDPKRDEKLQQYDLVQQFFADFRDKAGRLKGGINEYPKPNDFGEMFAGQLRTFLRLLRDQPDRLHESGRDEQEPDLDIPPYKGLLSLDENDARVFFGREREILEVLAQMQRERFVMIVGASGSGKSSLASAGVLPRLRARGNWRIARARPGADPFQSLADALMQGVPELNSQPVGTIVRALQAGGDQLEELLSGLLPEGTHTLLYIDQLEELFTLTEKAQGAQVIRSFAALLRYSSSSISVLATLRADFYEAALGYFEQELRRGGFSLGKPSVFGLREMIERPAERAKLELDDNLAELIISEVNDQPGTLPLVAYLLAQMHQRMEERHDRHMTRTDYDTVGGVRGAIGHCANMAYDEIKLPEARKAAALNRVFQELVELTDKQGELIFTRRRVAPKVVMNEPDAALVVNKLTAMRLLVADQQAIEVAHEALFTSWKTLANWIVGVQDDLHLVRQFERDAQDWERRGKPLELQPQNERLQLLLAATEHLRVKIIDPLVIEYSDLDTQRLVDELKEINTSHERRLFIGKRLGFLGDPRTGVGNKDHRFGVRSMTVPVIEWCYVGVQMDRHGHGPHVEVGRGVHPIHPVWIARYLITNQQFQAFLDDPDGYDNLAWWDETPTKNQRHIHVPNRGQHPNSPRENVSWYQAVAFTKWLTTRYKGLRLEHPSGSNRPSSMVGMNAQIRLPNEWEWQWAAQGGSMEREYPWEGKWDDRLANTIEAGLGETTSVGMYPGGAAACGALDMSGNVWEWCLNNFNFKGNKGLRGGSYHIDASYARCAARADLPRYRGDDNLGFRVVVAPLT